LILFRVVLVKVTAIGALEVPAVCPPKLRELGLTVAAAWPATANPDSSAAIIAAL
jgi:hypothetical protein